MIVLGCIVLVAILILAILYKAINDIRLTRELIYLLRRHRAWLFYPTDLAEHLKISPRRAGELIRSLPADPKCYFYCLEEGGIRYWGLGWSEEKIDTTLDASLLALLKANPERAFTVAELVAKLHNPEQTIHNLLKTMAADNDAYYTVSPDHNSIVGHR